MQVLITERIHESGIDLLRRDGVNVDLLYKTDQPLADAIREADGVVVRLAKVTEDIMRVGKLGKLKVVAKHGIGVDNIDVEAARRLGIRVVYTPGVMSDAVAEFTLGAILFLAKNFVKYDSEVRKGNWGIRYYANNLEIKGKTVGLIGYGHIGKKVAKLANCLGAHLIVYDPYVQIREAHVEQADLNTVLKDSDFLSIHVPLTKDTYHLIGRKELELVDGLYIINSARGGIIDEVAFCEAVEKGKVAGAVLDTTEQEPIALDNPILHSKNVILTAHTAGIADVAQVDESMLACRQVLQVLKGEEPPYSLA